jgi:hypothetical protein
VERKVFVGAAQAGDEVIFERANGAFGSVSAVDVRWSELVVDVDAGHELLESGGCFVVELLELWFESALGQESMGSFVGGENFRAGFALHGFNENGVAVVVVKD